MSEASLTETVYIGLGSNLGDPTTRILSAWLDLHHIPGTTCRALSALYHSAPVGPAEQPVYVNAAAQLVTTLSPHQLLDALQDIEARHQRVRALRWGPRTLDLDILLFGNRTMEDTRLRIPHSQLRVRNFVLAPLLDLNPTLALPDQTPVQYLLDLCGWQGLNRWSGTARTNTRGEPAS